MSNMTPTPNNASELSEAMRAMPVRCPLSRCNAEPGKRCRSRDGQPHSERNERAEAYHELSAILAPGSKVYTVLRHVSRSGMSRRIDLYTPTLDSDGEPGVRYLTGYVAKLLGYPRHDSGALTVRGCGKDMGYHLVSSLSYALHGYTDKGNGPAGRPRGEATPERYRAGHSLSHDWL